ASLNERCIVRSVACCFAFRRVPHSIACSVLTKIGIRRVFSACLYAAPLCQFFIERFFECQRVRRHNKALLPALSNVVYWTLVLWVRNRRQQSTACLSRYGAAIAPRPTSSMELVSDDFPSIARVHLGPSAEWRVPFRTSSASSPLAKGLNISRCDGRSDTSVLSGATKVRLIGFRH